MHALIFNGIEDIHYTTVPDPGLQAPGDAIVRVMRTAVCGSDLHVYHGREQGLDQGTIMGHEFMGEVVAVGKEVTSFKEGDRVVCPFTTSCGRCFYCKTGLTCRCEHGSLFGWVEGGEGLHGAQAEYVRVPLAEGSLMKLPQSIDPNTGLFLGDIMSTGYFVADNAGFQKESVVAVVGCGPVGLMAVIGALELGASVVYALDGLPERLELARGFGAVPLDYTQQNPGEIIREATNGRGADAVLECVGSASAASAAYDLVRPGGIISVAGVHNDPHFPFSPAQAYDKNLTYKVGRCPARFYMEPLLELLQQGRYDLSTIISHQQPLSQGREAYAIFAERRDCCTKVILTPDAH